MRVLVPWGTWDGSSVIFCACLNAAWRCDGQ
ncbi:hypothetical protein HNR14_000957 [Leifsonia naganoensis]|uniref:Uncharacterized protein n=1 Tax=Leifsonia naganoensis TaxID=150025 RepID=A0A853DJ26_9MICO|nr:hypothetical protein [Leifsonia naganoensis]